MAMALTGDVTTAQQLVGRLARNFPEDTIVKFNYLPALEAQLALNRREPTKAIDGLQVSSLFELGQPGDATFMPSLYPVYLRGQACRMAHQGGEAAAEFQKILDHSGIVLNEPIGALAHLHFGRAYAMQGDTAKGRCAYQDFLALWKDADPEIPILQQAKSEFAKLQ